MFAARLRSALAAETGMALADALIGIIVAALTLTVLSTVAISAYNAVGSSVDASARQQFLQNTTASLALNPQTVPTEPITTVMTIGTTHADVTTWRVTTNGQEVIHAATPRHSGGSTVICDDTTTIDCLGAQTAAPKSRSVPVTDVPVSWTGVAADGAVGALERVGPLGVFQVPATVTEIRYVFRAAAAPADGSIIFTDQQSGSTLSAAAFVAAGDGYLFGSLTVTPGNAIMMDVQGSDVTMSHFTLYEAPK